MCLSPTAAALLGWSAGLRLSFIISLLKYVDFVDSTAFSVSRYAGRSDVVVQDLRLSAKWTNSEKSCSTSLPAFQTVTRLEASEV